MLLVLNITLTAISFFQDCVETLKIVNPCSSLIKICGMKKWYFGGLSMKPFILYIFALSVLFSSCSPTDKPVTGKQGGAGGAAPFGETGKLPPEDFRNILFLFKSALSDINALYVVNEDKAGFLNTSQWIISRSEYLIRDSSVERNKDSSYLEFNLFPQVNANESHFADTKNFQISQNTIDWKIKLLKTKNDNNQMAFSGMFLTNEGGEIYVKSKATNREHRLTSEVRKISFKIENNSLVVSGKSIYSTNDDVLKQNSTTIKTYLVFSYPQEIKVNIQTLADVKALISVSKLTEFTSQLVRSGAANYQVRYVTDVRGLSLDVSTGCLNASGVLKFNYNKDFSKTPDPAKMKFTEMILTADQATISKNSFQHLSCIELNGAIDTSLLLQN